jgi:hypothetical protein
MLLPLIFDSTPMKTRDIGKARQVIDLTDTDDSNSDCSGLHEVSAQQSGAVEALFLPDGAFGNFIQSISNAVMSQMSPLARL